MIGVTDGRIIPVSRLTNRDRKLSLTSSDTRSEETKSLKAMAIILSWPPLVKQEGPTCWAAAMDSWTSVTSSQKYFSSDELVELAKGHGAATSSGALNGESGLRWLMSQFVLSEEHGGQSDGIVTPSAIEPKLRESHVVFIHKTVVADSFSHAWVIYGIDELAVYYMDPLLGRWEHGEWMHFTFEVQIALWRKQP